MLILAREARILPSRRMNLQAYRMRITTLTGNLLAEWTCDIEELQSGTRHRAKAASFQVGGKGVNVAKVLQRFGNETSALAFADGAIGDHCGQWLETHGIPHRLFPLGAEVRNGLVVRAANGTETTFLGLDQPVPQDSWSQAMEWVAREKPAWLAICGSIPGWRDEWTHSVESLLTQSPVRVAVDTYGPPLTSLARLPLDLVKINRSELERLYKLPEKTDWGPICSHLRERSPVKNWIITDGANPVHAHFLHSGAYRIVPADIEEISPTGSGDTFLAALLAQWEAAPEAALTFAAACATANAASAQIGDFPIPPPKRFSPAVVKLS